MVLYVKEDVAYKSTICAVKCKRVEKKPRKKLVGMKKGTVWYSQTLPPCLDFSLNRQLFLCPSIVYVEHSIEICFVNGSWGSRPCFIFFLVIPPASMPAMVNNLISSGWLGVLRVQRGDCQAYVAVIVPIGHGCAAVIVALQWYGRNG